MRDTGRWRGAGSSNGDVARGERLELKALGEGEVARFLKGLLDDRLSVKPGDFPGAEPGCADCVDDILARAGNASVYPRGMARCAVFGDDDMQVIFAGAACRARRFCERGGSTGLVPKAPGGLALRLACAQECVDRAHARARNTSPSRPWGIRNLGRCRGVSQHFLRMGRNGDQGEYLIFPAVVGSIGPSPGQGGDVVGVSSS